MKIANLQHYEIHLPTSGGKAGRGYAKTSTLQVRFDSCIVKQFRFVIGDARSRKLATKKVKQWVRENPAANMIDRFLANPAAEKL